MYKLKLTYSLTNILTSHYWNTDTSLKLLNNYEILHLITIKSPKNNMLATYPILTLALYSQVFVSAYLN